MSWILRVVPILLVLSLHNISAQEKIHTLYFLGDAGNTSNSVSVLNLLSQQIKPNESNTIIIIICYFKNKNCIKNVIYTTNRVY